MTFSNDKKSSVILESHDSLIQKSHNKKNKYFSTE